jgi:uncharacterized protein YhaN
MRLRSLELTRYGKFTGHRLDFGARVDGEADFHIVYGPNEAGKSTALSAYLDLLYGIEMQSRYGFLHPYGTMHIGATLEWGAKTHAVARIKRPQSSLLDANDQPVPEQLILGQLGGIDRKSYRARFSLDDDTLETGGDAILASRGDLGEMLFSGAAGLADLSQILAELRAEADAFYKARARSSILADYKARIAALREQREAIDTAATTYGRLVETRDRARELYETAVAERGAVQTRMDDVQRIVAALPRLAALRVLRNELAPLADLPEAPTEWHADMPALQVADTELSVRLTAAAADVARQTAALASIEIDAAALDVAERVDGWNDMRARAVTAAKDIPDRRIEVRKEDLVIAGILARLGQTDHPHPRDLVPDAATMGALRALLETRSGIDAAMQAAMRELEAARQRHDAARAAALQAGIDMSASQADPAAGADLGLAVKAAQTDDHRARRRIAQRSEAECLAEITDRLHDLLPWQGDIEALAALRVPDTARIEQWKNTLAAARQRHDRYQDTAERHRTECVRRESELQALSTQTGLLSDQEAAMIRAERETAWAAHRRTLDADSADRFEAVLRRDDIATGNRLRHEADTSKMQQIATALAVARADEALAHASLAATAAEIQAIEQAVTAAIAAMAPALPATTTITQLEYWLARRKEILEVRTRLRQARLDLRAAQDDAEAIRQRLTTALAAAGIAHESCSDPDALQSIAQTTLERQAEHRALHDQLHRCEHDMKSRARALATAEADAQRWSQAWSQACGTTWLDAHTVPAVREILEVLAGLGPALDRRAGLIDRIEKMQLDEQAFAIEVATVAVALSLDTDGVAPLELDRLITARIQRARQARDLKAEKSAALASTEQDYRNLQATAAMHHRRAAAMTAFFGVASLAEVATKLHDIARRRDVRQRAADTERDILTTLRVASMADAENLLDTADRTALDTELAELRGRFADQDQRVQQLFSEHSKAVDKLEAVGGDEAAARIEAQRRTVLLEIEAGARRAIGLRAGIIAAEHALRAYRQKHRSSMMARASEAFATISRGAYTGLTSQPDRDSEILLALGADGSSKIASDLSKGTRFQLYLALRVAGYHEFAKLRDPVPFISDDIMETFDDFRAEEALRVFADMAQIGQVIYMTHHLHLCDIAQRICPQVRVHRLDA